MRPDEEERPKKNRWDETPVTSAGGETPARGGGWGETPSSVTQTPSGAWPHYRSRSNAAEGI